MPQLAQDDQRVGGVSTPVDPQIESVEVRILLGILIQGKDKVERRGPDGQDARHRCSVPEGGHTTQTDNAFPRIFNVLPLRRGSPR
jgi:hypothetical protein